MRSPVLNPIKFYDPAALPDYVDIFPGIDNTPYGSQYIYCINRSESFIKEHIGYLYLQFEAEISDNMAMLIYRMGDDGAFSYAETILGSIVSPSGWVTKPMYKFSLNLDDGYYYVRFNNGYRSDYFRYFQNPRPVGDDLASIRRLKKLVKVKYSHSENDFSCIFGDNYFTTYFTGNLFVDDIKNDVEAYEDDDGGIIKATSMPQSTAILSIKNVHYSYLKKINTIFSCDTIEVNGIAFQNADAPQWQSRAGSDTGDVTVKLIRTTNDHFYDELGEVPPVPESSYALDYNDDIFTDYNGDRFLII